MNRVLNCKGQSLLETVIVFPILFIGISVFSIVALATYFRSENSFLTQELSACYKSQWERGDCTRLYRKKLRLFPGHWRLKSVQENQDKISVLIRSRLNQTSFGDQSGEVEPLLFRIEERKPWP